MFWGDLWRRHPTAQSYTDQQQLRFRSVTNQRESLSPVQGDFLKPTPANLSITKSHWAAGLSNSIQGKWKDSVHSYIVIIFLVTFKAPQLEPGIIELVSKVN